jgi:hypothetical protein
LKKHDNGGQIIFDPLTSQIETRGFTADVDWTDFNGDVAEEMSPQMPEPKGKPVVMSCFVDANHAGGMVTCRLHSGFLSMYRMPP